MIPPPLHPARTGLSHGPITLVRTDPRWLLAARACLLAAPGGVLPEATHDMLRAWAGRVGFSPIHARAVIGIGAAAAARGGLDARAAAELASIPAPTPITPLYPRVVIGLMLALLTTVTLLLAWWRL